MSFEENIYNFVRSAEGRSFILLLIKEEQLLIEIECVSNEEFSNKIKNEFKSTYHSYDFENYLRILERVKKILIKGIDDFDDIKKIIYNNNLPEKGSADLMAAPITSTPVLKGKDLVDLIEDLKKPDTNKDRRKKALQALQIVSKG